MQDSAQLEAIQSRKRVVLDTSRPLPSADYDPDMDDDLPQNKPAKKARKPPPIKRAPRLQFCGQHGADKAIMHARDNGSDVRIVVVTLDWRKTGYAEADETIVANVWSGNEPYALGNEDQGLTCQEFMGLFCTEAFGEPGVAAQIASKLLANEHNHVVVVDGTRNGDEYARLAAFAAAHFYKLDASGDDALWKSLAKFPADTGRPHFAAWQAVLVKMARIRNLATLRVAMKEHWETAIRNL